MGVDPEPETALAKVIRQQRGQAREARDALRAATEAAGCPLPSLGIDQPSWFTGQVLVDLGRAGSDHVLRLATVIWAGLAALEADLPSAARAWRPRAGDLVVDAGSDRVGVYRGEIGSGWQFAPVAGGPEWTADPSLVRPPSSRDRIRARAAIATARSSNNNRLG